MVQAPRRTQAHMTDSKACLLVAQLFSENWVLRDLTERDYGIDRIAERFHDECGTSEMLILQIKGTKSNIDKNNPRFSLETKTPMRVAQAFWTVATVQFLQLLSYQF